MIIFPTCKINLGLHVLEKRIDGFHSLETVMVEIPWTDEIEFKESNEDSFEIKGLEISGNNNLILQALRLARTHTTIPPLKICLKKNIPMGAGLGGGSSDAAKFYAELAKFYFPGRTITDLENDISSIGSDCAFFIKGGTQLCTGRGEILNPIHLDLKGKHLVIVNPGIHISTAEAFGKITPNSDRESIENIVKLDINEWNGRLKNDFEESLFPLYPELRTIKSRLIDYGAAYAAMTGSGSTMFGIFSDLRDAATSKIDEARFMKLISF